MDDTSFEVVKANLDADINSRRQDTNYGISMGSTLYGAFRARGLLKPKLADFIHWKWTLPSYQDRFVCEGFEVADDEYKLGNAKT